jgi:hypothetical protein
MIAALKSTTEKLRHAFLSKKAQKVSLYQILGFVLLVFLLVPGGRVGFETLTTWGDQSALLRTLKEWQSTGDAPLLSSNWMGPGFVAINFLLFRLFGSFESSLTVLTLSSFILIYVILFREALKSKAPWMKVQALVLLLASIFFIKINQLRDIPWTHFITGAMVFLIIYSFHYAKKNFLFCLPMGFLFFLSWQTRNFETFALLISVLTFYLVRYFLLKEWKKDLRTHLNQIRSYLVFFTTGMIFAWAAIGVISGRFQIFVQYQGMLPSSDFSIERLFKRVTQVFVAPTWNTLSSETLNPKTTFLQNLSSTSFETWYSPLIHSSPLLLPLTFVAVYLLFSEVMLMKRFQVAEKSDHSRIIILNLTALLILLGYLTQPIVGSTHLKYGLLREFVLPQLLILLAIFLRWNSPANKIKPAGFSFKKFQPSILVLIAFVSMAIQPLKMQPYESLRVSPVNGECARNLEFCEIDIRVLKSNKWEKLPSQPVEFRTMCEGEAKSHYSKSFTLKIELCKSAHTEVFAIPLIFGLSTSPEANLIFEEYREVWFKVPDFVN